jgi:hypothetical protein
MGSQNLPILKYNLDNVDITFEYGIDWNIKTEGDTSSSKNIKYIQLDNKLDNSSINLTLYYKDSSENSECEKYNDCGLQFDQNIFEFDKKSFELIKSTRSIFISSLGGTDISWGDNNQNILSGTKPLPNNYYYIYKLDGGKLNQAIEVDTADGLYIEVSYMISDKNQSESFARIKKALEQILKTLKGKNN